MALYLTNKILYIKQYNDIMTNDVTILGLNYVFRL